MAIFGFIVLVLVGLYFVVLAVQLYVGLTLFGGGGGIAIVPAGIAGVIFWTAFHFAPFTIAFTGA